MKIEFKLGDIEDEIVLDFLIDESFELFCEQIIKKDLSLKSEKILKSKLKYLYEKEIQKTDKVYTASIAGNLIGCAYINKNNHIKDLFVKKEYRNQKIGSHLLEILIKDCEKFGNFTLCANPKAVNLYKKYSFKEVKQKNNSIIMERKKTK